MPVFSHYSWLGPLVGGGLIGSAAAVLSIFQRRIAGISGIVGGLVAARSTDRSWRAAFLVGLLLGGGLMARAYPGAFGSTNSSPLLTAAAGLLVGVGTTLANGCTSGHGVCGVSRLSPRSLVATGTFMAAGVVVVFLVRQLGNVPV